MGHLIEALLVVANQGALELLVWSWQAVVLLGCVWAGLKLLRVQTPALRQHIWLIALLAIFSLPIWSQLSPKLPLPERQRWNKPVLNYAAELPRLVITPTVEPTLPVKQPVAGAAAPKSRAVSRALAGIFCLWFVGALWMLAHNVRGYARLRRARLQARSVTPADLGCVSRLPNSIRLCLSTEVRSPVLLGLWPPLILLPHDLAEWTTVEEREAMIAHELAHLARRDHFTNLFPLALNVVFFFHPLVRYACHQFCLEREMACDDCVIHHGADATTYAESLVKAAEHSLKGKLSGLAAYSLHQPAFFTSKQALERRIEMILNTNRVRVLARQWRYLVLPMLLLIALTLLLSSSSLPGRAKINASPSVAQEDDLVERAIANPDVNVRLAAVQRLAQIKGERGTLSLLEVYQRSTDAQIKEAVIRRLAERGEISPLAAIGQVEQQPELREVSKQALNDLLARKQQAKLDAFNSAGTPPPPPPPPPPPIRSSLPIADYGFEVIGSESRNLLKPLGYAGAQLEGKAGLKLKLPHFNLIASYSNFVLQDGVYYLLDRFEVELDNNARLYGSGTLRVLPKTDSIEYALSSGGGIYLNPGRTKKVGLTEFLQ